MQRRASKSEPALPARACLAAKRKLCVGPFLLALPLPILHILVEGFFELRFEDFCEALCLIPFAYNIKTLSVDLRTISARYVWSRNFCGRSSTTAWVRKTLELSVNYRLAIWMQKSVLFKITTNSWRASGSLCFVCILPHCTGPVTATMYLWSPGSPWSPPQSSVRNRVPDPRDKSQQEAGNRKPAV